MVSELRQSIYKSEASPREKLVALWVEETFDAGQEILVSEAAATGGVADGRPLLEHAIGLELVERFPTMNAKSRAVIGYRRAATVDEIVDAVIVDDED